MYSLPQFLKEIRNELNFTQEDLAKSLEVSKVLVSMIETEQKKPSKKFIKILASKLKVHPGTLAIFAYDFKQNSPEKLSVLEQKLLSIGTELQKKIVAKNSKNLLNYANK